MNKDIGRVASPPGASSLRSPEPVPVSAHAGDAPSRGAAAAFKAFWSEQSRRGDPARNPNLTKEAFEAGFKAGTPTPVEYPLRRCGYCQSWNSKPCGEQCVLSPTDPTWEDMNRDSDGSPKGGDAEGGSVRSTTARPEGIAQ